jgi:hypothetical protein
MDPSWWLHRDDWKAYLHARQLYIETGDRDALANMIDHVTERDGDIPDQTQQIAWRSPMGPDIVTVRPDDLRCY